MRWFKHLSTAHQDENMAALIGTMGAEGYGVWWIILESIAQQMDSTDKCSARYTAKKWGNFCGFSAKKFEKFAEKLAEFSPISVQKDGEFLIIECRNLLKYRDEYTKKSGQSPEKLPPKIQSIETEADKRKNKPTAIADGFDEFWQQYPVKKGKEAARKAWKKIPQPIVPEIMTALAEQVDQPSWVKDGGKFIPHPATWLNNKRWEDEIEEEEQPSKRPLMVGGYKVI